MKTIEIIRVAWGTRRAWWFTATAKTKERFARTTLGSFWLGLSNLLSIVVLASVYGAVFKVSDFRSYAVFLGLGLVTWNTIAGAVLSAPTLLKANAGNIKNTNIHPIFYTLEEWAFQVQTFMQSFGLVAVALSFFQYNITTNILFAGLLPLLNLLIFIYWFPLVVCILGSKYEDLYQLVPIILQLMFLLSPILYRKEALGNMSWTAEWNPLYIILDEFRGALITGKIGAMNSISVLVANLIGVYVAIRLLERKRSILPLIL